jgi:hypothetical protein
MGKEGISNKPFIHICYFLKDIFEDGFLFYQENLKKNLQLSVIKSSAVFNFLVSEDL